MTKEENIATLNEHLEHWKRLLSEKICGQDEGEKTIDALQNAIKALEQEPCDDCISRSAVLDINERHHGQMPNHVNHEIWKEIKALPSITPQPKMGRWAILKDEYGDVCEAVCSCCDKNGNHKWAFCPFCGAKMSKIPTGAEGSKE